ncbi:MAG: 4-alpha-glucanotransferase [Clostridia bacterium]|nr:4-alpha-glucanotransferase [Clostridia bacterium]
MTRSAGVLLAVSSLPSRYGIGCFDQSAYDFVDWLAKAGQTYWQILPLGPTSFGKSDDSPYQSFSAFAGNPYFISLDALIEEGVLTREECDAADLGSDDAAVDYEKLHDNRLKLLRKAYERSNISHSTAYQQFLQDNSWWLADYALFMAVKNFFKGAEWTEWPEDIRMHWGFALDYYRRTLYYDVEFQYYMQFKFFEQWQALKAYANSKNIQIVGDIPIYVSPDGADIWAHPELFQLGEGNVPTAIAGCPPDAFSATGQIWKNPLYRWDYHRATGFEWWVSRMWQSFRLYDVVRIDHFRGFDEYFSIPATAESALSGHWEKGPGMDLFRTIEYRLGRKHIIAEDLGLMTETVRQLVRESGFPNMKVFQFAFDEGDVGAANDYLPHNYGHNCVVYTGTHDNETAAGWLAGLDEKMRGVVRDYLCDRYTPDEELYRSVVAASMRSCAQTCIIPIQDYLGLGNDCRMNVPSTVGVNWRWRLTADRLTDEVCDEILAVTRRYGRMNWANDKLVEESRKPAPAKEEEAAKGKKTAAAD